MIKCTDCCMEVLRIIIVFIFPFREGGHAFNAKSEQAWDPGGKTGGYHQEAC